MKWYDTVDSLLSKMKHIRERVHGEGIIYRAHAVCCRWVIIFQPGPGWKIKYVLLVDVFWLILNMFDGNDAMKGMKWFYFWNIIINKGSEEEGEISATV